MTNLPSSWAWSTLGDISSSPQYGFTTRASDSGKLRLLRTTDITSGSIDWETVPYCSEEPERPENYLLGDGDLVISRAGSVGVSHLIRSPFRAVFASYLIRFRPKIDPQYVAYFLKSPAYWRVISESQAGIAVPNVNASKLSNVAIPVAPLSEQRRIVAKIEELFSELDASAESLTRARAQLKTYRQALLKATFEGKLTANWRAGNDAWRSTRVGDEITYLTSGSRGWADYYATEGDIFIRAQNLKFDRLDLTDVAFVQLPAGTTEGRRTRVEVGDVLITITGANVTKTGFVYKGIGTAYVSQHVALCRPRRNIRPAFLHYFLTSESNGRKQLNNAAYGAGKPGLNLDNIREVEINVPSLDEQDLIVSRLDELITQQDNMDALLDGELARIEALRQVILKEAFYGRLVPQLSTDEPASTLLNRMRAQDELPKLRQRQTA